MATGAVFGAVRELFDFLIRADVTALIMCYDAGRPPFRKELSEANMKLLAGSVKSPKEYKGSREETHKDPWYIEYQEQLRASKPFFRSLGITVVSVDGFEGDDVVGLLAQNWSGPSCIIYSTDKDYHQLVGSRTTQWCPLKRKYHKVHDPVAVLRKALIGDSSDDIAGVPSIGPKRADDLLEAYMRWPGFSADPASFLKWCHTSRDKYAARVLEFSKVFTNTCRMVDLSITADMISLDSCVTLPQPDRAAFAAACREYEYHAILSQGHAFMSLFKRVNSAMLSEGVAA